MNTLSIQRLRPSIEIWMPALGGPVKVMLVNWLPWSVLKIRGLPKRCSASSSAATQNDASRVLDRQAPAPHRPARQSMIATR